MDLLNNEVTLVSAQLTFLIYYTYVRKSRETLVKFVKIVFTTNNPNVIHI